jgi:hypothetical protein
MNAACVPVSESGNGCPWEILVTFSSGRPRPTRWREWLGSRTPKGDATWRVITSSSAVSANSYPSVRIGSGHVCKIGNRSLTPDSAKETEDIQRKMIRFGCVLRMSGDG